MRRPRLPPRRAAWYSRLHPAWTAGFENRTGDSVGNPRSGPLQLFHTRYELFYDFRPCIALASQAVGNVLRQGGNLHPRIRSVFDAVRIGRRHIAIRRALHGRLEDGDLPRMRRRDELIEIDQPVVELIHVAILAFIPETFLDVAEIETG